MLRSGLLRLAVRCHRRDLFVGKGYLPLTLMQFSRGCRFACDFCAVSAYFKKTQYIRPTQEVLEEIRRQDRNLCSSSMIIFCPTMTLQIISARSDSDEDSLGISGVDRYDERS